MGAMNLKIPVLEGEYWYGGYVCDGAEMPVFGQAHKFFDFRRNLSSNQGMPLLLSNKGRYLWGEKDTYIEMKDGIIKASGKIVFHDGGQNLKDAYLDASKRYFPFRKCKLNSRLFTAPVYNTWIELLFNQNQKDILEYAQNILKNGLPAGTLMIDDGWSDYYGKWTFNKEKFPDAPKMLQELHKMGFRVMLWICPYITSDTETFRDICEKEMLIMENDETPTVIKWWNGYSAALDLSSPNALNWLDKQLQELMEIGVDGFKFDGGDSQYYLPEQKTYGNVSPDELTRLWCKYGEKYEFNEFRAGWKAGGLSLMQRLCDKPHSWKKDGIGALIPDVLTQGILGMPYSCPDMIGGGEYLNFLENSKTLDEELFVRYSEIACMMPVMQFSAAPWRVLKTENFECIKKSVKVRQKYADYLFQCVRETENTGEPIVRYMEYEFPDQGMECITDQFMIGDKLLIAPVCEKNASGRSVVIPQGEWVCNGKTIFGGGESAFFDSEKGVPVILWRK